jgi:flagellar motor switch protein FliN/FliY
MESKSGSRQKDDLKNGQSGAMGANGNDNSPESGGDGGDGEVSETTGDIGFILDIPLELSVELGRSKMLVIDLLGLSQGSIVELDKLAGEPLEVYINRKLVARGEVVVVNEKFGVRLTDIITPMERVRSLAGS